MSNNFVLRKTLHEIVTNKIEPFIEKVFDQCDFESVQTSLLIEELVDSLSDQENFSTFRQILQILFKSHVALTYEEFKRGQFSKKLINLLFQYKCQPTFVGNDFDIEAVEDKVKREDDEIIEETHLNKIPNGFGETPKDDHQCMRKRDNEANHNKVHHEVHNRISYRNELVHVIEELKCENQFLKTQNENLITGNPHAHCEIMNQQLIEELNQLESELKKKRKEKQQKVVMPISEDKETSSEKTDGFLLLDLLRASEDEGEVNSTDFEDMDDDSSYEGSSGSYTFSASDKMTKKLPDVEGDKSISLLEMKIQQINEEKNSLLEENERLKKEIEIRQKLRDTEVQNEIKLEETVTSVVCDHIDHNSTGTFEDLEELVSSIHNLEEENQAKDSIIQEYKSRLYELQCYVKLTRQGQENTTMPAITLNANRSKNKSLTSKSFQEELMELEHRKLPPCSQDTNKSDSELIKQKYEFVSSLENNNGNNSRLNLFDYEPSTTSEEDCDISRISHWDCSGNRIGFRLSNNEHNSKETITSETQTSSNFSLSQPTNQDKSYSMGDLINTTDPTSDLINITDPDMEGLPSPIIPLYSPFLTDSEDVDYAQGPNYNMLAFTKNKRELIPRELRSTMMENSIPEETSDGKSDDTERRDIEPSISEGYVTCQETLNEHELANETENGNENDYNNVHEGFIEWKPLEVICETSSENDEEIGIECDNHNFENTTNEQDVSDELEPPGVVICETCYENDENKLNKSGTINEIEETRNKTGNINTKYQDDSRGSQIINLIEKYSTKEDLTQIGDNSKLTGNTNDLKELSTESLNDSQECSNYTKYLTKLKEFSKKTEGQNNVQEYPNIPEDPMKFEEFSKKTEDLNNVQDYSNSAEDLTKLEEFSKKTEDLKEISNANEDLKKLEDFATKTQYLKECIGMSTSNEDLTNFEEFSRNTKDLSGIKENVKEKVELHEAEKKEDTDSIDINKVEISNTCEKQMIPEKVSIKSDELNEDKVFFNMNQNNTDIEEMSMNFGDVSTKTRDLNGKNLKLTNDELFTESLGLNNLNEMEKVTSDQTKVINKREGQLGFEEIVDKPGNLDETLTVPTITEKIGEERSNKINESNWPMNQIEHNLDESREIKYKALKRETETILKKNTTVDRENEMISTENECSSHSDMTNNKNIMSGNDALCHSDNNKRDTIDHNEKQSNEYGLEPPQNYKKKYNASVPAIIENYDELREKSGHEIIWNYDELAINDEICPTETIPQNESTSSKSPELTEDHSNNSENSTCSSTSSGNSMATTKSLESKKVNQLVPSTSQICTVSTYISPTKCREDCTQCVNVREVIDIFESLYRKNLYDADSHKTSLTFTKRSGNGSCKKHKHILNKMNNKLKELDIEFSQTEGNAAFHQYREPSGDCPIQSHHFLSEKLQECWNKLNKSFHETDADENDLDDLNELIQGFNCLKLREESPVVLREPTITVLDVNNDNISEIDKREHKLVKQKSAPLLNKKKSNKVLRSTKRNKNQSQTINNNLELKSQAKEKTSEISSLSNDMGVKPNLSVNKALPSLHVNLNRSLPTPHNELNNSQNLLVLSSTDIVKKNATFECNYSRNGNHFMNKRNNIDIYNDRKVNKNKVDHQLGSTPNGKCVKLSSQNNTLALNDMRTQNLNQSRSLLVNNRSYPRKSSTYNGSTCMLTIGSTICSFTIHMVRLFMSLLILTCFIIIALILYQQLGQTTCPSCTQLLTFLGDLLATKLEHFDGPPPI
ncbi:hypothetical protein WDU94_008362 [Cyamophila willieti]